MTLGSTIVTLLPLLPPRTEPVRVNVSLDAGLLGAIDAAAKAHGMTRSGFLADAARRALAG
ncbi:MAG: type II toxin-antitoxin system HicB family antitoxin [Rhodospirillaceae bacterium]